MHPVLDENIEDDRLSRLRKTLTVILWLERTALALLLVGYIFRMQHWPFSGIIILVSFALFLTLSIVRIFYVKEKLVQGVKVIATAVMMAGWVLNMRGMSIAGTFIIIGLVLYLSFHFFGNRK